MVDKEKWAEVVKDWHEKSFPETVGRELKINFESGLKRSSAIIGPRRAGKTYEMYITIKKIVEKFDRKRVLYVNFERADLGVLDYKDLVSMLEVYYEIYPENEKERVWLFLDELQNVSGWEKFVRTCLDNNIKVFVSGSSSKLLSKEIATSMRGRNLTFEIFPFSFKEYLNAKGFGIKKYYSSGEKAQIKKYLKEYFVWGGYPEVVLFPEEREKILKDIFETAILKDVAERHGVRNMSTLKIFIQALINSKEFSVNKFYNYLKSQGIKVGKNVLYNYLGYLEDAFFVFPLRKFSLSYKKAEQSLPKIYFVDNGLLTVNRIDDRGRLMENMVFVELLRRGLNVSYWKNSYNEEVDFVISEGKKVKQLIQVCFDLGNFMTRDREVRALVKAGKEFGCEDLVVVNMSEDRVEVVWGVKIRYVSLWKWIL